METMEIRYAAKHLVSLLPHNAACLALIDVYNRIDHTTRERVFVTQTGKEPTAANIERMEKCFPTSSIRSTICEMIDSLPPSELSAFYLNASKFVRHGI